MLVLLIVLVLDCQGYQIEHEQEHEHETKGRPMWVAAPASEMPREAAGDLKFEI